MEGSKISEYKGVLLTTTNFVVWEREIRDFLEENDLIDLVISSDREKNRKKGLEGPGRVRPHCCQTSRRQCENLIMTLRRNSGIS